MSGVAILRYQLILDYSVVNVVPEPRIMAGTLPINTELPAISIKQVSGSEFKTIKRSGEQLVIDRIQVTALAQSYVQQKEMIESIRNALPTVRGIVNDIYVDSIEHELDGPDLYSENPVIYEQSIDYIVRYVR